MIMTPSNTVLRVSFRVDVNRFDHRSIDRSMAVRRAGRYFVGW